MTHGRLATLAVGLFLVVPAVPAVAQQCFSYEPDPRLEAQYGNPALTQADVLITSTDFVHDPPPTEEGLYRMDLRPWLTFHNWPTPIPACPDRDYHGQQGVGTVGSGVLVGPNLVLTARHVVKPQHGGIPCDVQRYVFGFGHFTPDQWQCDGVPCTVTLPPEDVYRCVSVASAPATVGEDWAVVTLDRNVEGRTPLPILREPTFPPASTPVTVVGHPNRIPMKVEYATVSIPSIYWINAHVINGSSGSMVVDEATGKVIGVVSGGHNPLAPGCEFDTEPQCKRERFSAPVNVALTPAWQAALHIP